ncbi:helix-turn-helix transcriptional regulator [Sinorhizobium meliloti]|uniref:helix-turn-helix domain-containing protein n=1 Tax=Rhizobium meliloti TaxID=382 RepID=UPI00299DC7CC|nr:helix-turn-helix domain-containing protein [Sinorhizobium meliloti]
MVKKTPHPIDIHVGSRIRLQRAFRGISQTELAEGIGVTFQQVQKYEKGTNRVSPSRLQAIAGILRAPPAYFFDEGPGASRDPQQPETGSGEVVAEFLSSTEGLALNRAFVKIHDAAIRRRFVDLVKQLAD